MATSLLLLQIAARDHCDQQCCSAKDTLYANRTKSSRTRLKESRHKLPQPGLAGCSSNDPARGRAVTTNMVANVIANASFPRVLGVGLPHTGTSTLHSMLRRLGCCYNAHNTHCTSSRIGEYHNESLSSLWLFRTTNVTRTRNIAASHAANGDLSNLIAELQHFQCVSDSPWADYWSPLAELPGGWESSRLVLTVSRSAFAYAVTKFVSMHYTLVPRVIPSMKATRRRDELVESMEGYIVHVLAVRERYGSSGRLTEFCVQCGDGYAALGVGLGLSSDALHGLLASTGLNHSSPAPRVNGARSGTIVRIHNALKANFSFLADAEPALWRSRGLPTSPSWWRVLE